MISCIALLRGINVGGKNILPMKDLVAVFEQAGYQQVKTYIQSGNVVFQSAAQPVAADSTRLRSLIAAQHGFEVDILLLSAAELQAVIAANPYPVDDGKVLHFFFLAAQPKTVDSERLQALSKASESFQLADGVFYLYAPEGIGRSKLAAGVEKVLGVPVTARNWNTVSKLESLLNAVD